VDANRLADMADVERLIYDHFHAVDSGDVERQADLFARARVRYMLGDAVLMETNDRESFHRQISGARIYPDGTPRTHHIISNVRVDVASDGTVAHAHFYSTVMQAVDGSPLQAIACGQFFDELAKDENGWYFTDRIGRLRFVSDALDNHVPPSSTIGERLQLAKS